MFNQEDQEGSSVKVTTEDSPEGGEAARREDTRSRVFRFPGTEAAGVVKGRQG